jgi:hypothetical protein
MAKITVLIVAAIVSIPTSVNVTGFIELLSTASAVG